MLKRLAAAVFFTGTALFICIASFIYTDGVIEDMLEVTEETDLLYSREQAYLYEAERLIRLWDENSLLLGIILKNADSDRASLLFTTLEGQLERGDEAEFIRSLRELEGFLRVLHGRQKPLIENIF